METKMSITMLPARKKASLINQDEENPKLRVAAYCRVSTDSEEQETSYEAQISHYGKQQKRQLIFILIIL